MLYLSCIAGAGLLTSLLPVHSSSRWLKKKPPKRKISPYLLSRPLCYTVLGVVWFFFLITSHNNQHITNKHTTSILQTLQSYNGSQPLSHILANTYPQVSLEVSLLLEKSCFVDPHVKTLSEHHWDSIPKSDSQFCNIFSVVWELDSFDNISVVWGKKKKRHQHTHTNPRLELRNGVIFEGKKTSIFSLKYYEKGTLFIEKGFFIFVEISFKYREWNKHSGS